MKAIRDLNDFILIIKSTIPLRRRLCSNFIFKRSRNQSDIENLEFVLSHLKSLPGDQYLKSLPLSADNGGKDLSVDISYEIKGLEKDLVLLNSDPGTFISYLASVYKNFSTEVSELTSFLHKKKIRVCITDRDGTVNNYCARYETSVQSVYNAFFLNQYFSSLLQSVILTSAPLLNIGMADISVMPTDNVIFAGSKGREFLDKASKLKRFPIESDKQQKLDELNQKLKDLCSENAYRNFTYIGSGLQFKFGQTTIARQDILTSIKPAASLAFLGKIKKLVTSIDPGNKYFRIEDTGKDIEIMLTVSEQDNSLKDFDKGDGVDFLNKHAGLKLKNQSILICGDTNSDITILKKALQYSSNTSAVFVTTDKSLRKKVKSLCPDSFFVTSPDVLVTGLFKSIE